MKKKKFKVCIDYYEVNNLNNNKFVEETFYCKNKEELYHKLVCKVMSNYQWSGVFTGIKSIVEIED